MNPELRTFLIYSTNIDDNEYIEVRLETATVDFYKNGFSYAGFFTNDGMRLQNGDVIMTAATGGTQTFYYTFYDDGIHAGDYTSSVTFSFALREN